MTSSGMKKNTITLHELHFTKEALSRMDKKERDFLLVLGHVTNDLMAVHRLVLVTGNFPMNNRTIRQAGTSQNLVMIRVLIGLMHETWTFIARELLQQPLYGRYVAKIKQDFPNGREALDRLKDYFQGSKGEKNVETVRNDFAFHYPSHKWKLDAWQRAPQEELVFHLADRRVNSFYELSYAVVMREMLARVGSDPQIALNKLMDETVKVSGWLLDLTHDALVIAAERYASPGRPIIARRQDVPVRDAESVAVPCFVKGRLHRARS
jgi:hypothetical protein